MKTYLSLGAGVDTTAILLIYEFDPAEAECSGACMT